MLGLRVCNVFPCGHSSTVVLKDGRSVSHLTSYEICSIVSKIAMEKINPGKSYSVSAARETISHFNTYSQSRPSMGWYAETPEVVLSRLFAEK